MPANIEIKAVVRDFAALQQRAAALSDTPVEVIPQEDIFFVTAKGRLKLRLLAPGRAQLVYYERPDQGGPKRSNYHIFTTDNPEDLKTALSLALGVRGVVRKTRSLYMIGQTRLHLDEVEGLGNFMELEVVLRPGQSDADGRVIAGDLMAKLGILSADLVEGAYIDLLEKLRMDRPAFPALRTERLLLRELRPGDAPAVFEIFRREDVNTWLDRDPMQVIEEAERSIRSRMSLFANGFGFRWAISPEDDPDRLIGSCGYFSVRRGTATVEMGYELHPDYWRRGIMTEALRAVIAFSYGGQTLLPVHRIEALVMPGNTGSIRLLEKLGFRNEGLRREFGFWRGSHQDVLLFALLPGEWNQSSLTMSHLQ